jgi:hypothetical protein
LLSPAPHVIISSCFGMRSDNSSAGQSIKIALKCQRIKKYLLAKRRSNVADLFWATLAFHLLYRRPSDYQNGNPRFSAMVFFHGNPRWCLPLHKISHKWGHIWPSVIYDLVITPASNLPLSVKF